MAWNWLRTALLPSSTPRPVWPLYWAVVIGVALLTSTGLAAADPGTGTTITSTLLPLQEEFCSTEGGALISDFMGIIVVVFFATLLSAILLGGAIEALPLTGWFNQVGFSIMGKIPVAIMFVFIALSAISMVDGTFGLTAPSCVPIVG